MNQRAIDHLERTLDKHLTFEIGPTLSRGFEIWKQDIGSFTAFGLLYFIIVVVCNLVPGIGPLVSGLVISPALVIGGAFYAHRIYTNQSISFNNFFDGFDHWKNLAVVGLITFGLLFAIMVPMFLIVGFGAFAGSIDGLSATSPLAGQGLGSIIGLIALFFVIMFFLICISYAAYFVGFYEVSGMAAIKYSYRFVLPNFFWVLLFAIVAGIISGLGILGLLVGILLTYPMTFAFQYSAFEELTDYAGYIEDKDQPDSVNIDDMFR